MLNEKLRISYFFQKNPAVNVHGWNEGADVVVAFDGPDCKDGDKCDFIVRLEGRASSTIEELEDELNRFVLSCREISNWF